MESVCQSVRHDSMPLHTTCTLVQRHTGHFKQAAGDSPWVKECLMPSSGYPIEAWPAQSESPTLDSKSGGGGGCIHL
jgi:hypothetical protein